MGADGKDFNSSDRVPQAEENRASGPWGAGLTSREKKRTGFRHPSSPSVKPRMWERGPGLLRGGQRAPPATWSGLSTAVLTEIGPRDAKALLVCLGVTGGAPLSPLADSISLNSVRC